PGACNLLRRLPEEPGHDLAAELGLVLELGAGEARTQRGDGDPGAVALGGDALGESADEGLAGGVRRPPGNRLEACRRRDVQDPATAAGEHPTEGRVREAYDREHVEADH